MFNPRFGKALAASLLITGGLGMAVFGLAGTANATTTATDTNFLSTLSEQGFSGDAQTEIAYGKAVCSALDKGTSPDDVVSALANKTGLSPTAAKKFALIAADAYCPQYVDTPSAPSGTPSAPSATPSAPSATPSATPTPTSPTTSI